MTLGLTCAVCLASTGLAVAPPPADATPIFGFQLEGVVGLPAPHSLPQPTPGVALGLESLPVPWLAHDHGSAPPGDDSHHGSWMTTTMLVVMVAMMVTVGAVMMARGTRLDPGTAKGPAAKALPGAGGLLLLPGR